MEAVLSLVEVAGKARTEARDGSVGGRAAFDLLMTYATGFDLYRSTDGTERGSGKRARTTDLRDVNQSTRSVDRDGVG
jgi:hypothetical protein